MSQSKKYHGVMFKALYQLVLINILAQSAMLTRRAV